MDRVSQLVTWPSTLSAASAPASIDPNVAFTDVAVCGRAACCNDVDVPQRTGMSNESAHLPTGQLTNAGATGRALAIEGSTVLYPHVCDAVARDESSPSRDGFQDDKVVVYETQFPTPACDGETAVAHVLTPSPFS